MSTLDDAVAIAPLVVDAIAKILEAYRAVQSGAVKSADVLAKMQAVHASLDSDHAAEDAALAEKFPAP